jgi:hypothetical protein
MPELVGSVSFQEGPLACVQLHGQENNPWPVHAAMLSFAISYEAGILAART